VSIRKSPQGKFLRAAQRYLVSAWGHSEMIATAAETNRPRGTSAISLGLRHIDAHPRYGNEECIGTISAGSDETVVNERICG